MTAPHMLGPTVVAGYVDKRKALGTRGDPNTHVLARSIAPFTCNGAGTTLTAVGANAAPGTNDNNVARRGEKFQLFTAAGAKKEETVFTVSGIAVAAGTTITFTPAAAVATANTDVLRWVGLSDLEDESDLNSRLLIVGYTAAQLSSMSQNDKILAMRQADNSDGV